MAGSAPPRPSAPTSAAPTSKSGRPPPPLPVPGRIRLHPRRPQHQAAAWSSVLKLAAAASPSSSGFASPSPSSPSSTSSPLSLDPAASTSIEPAALDPTPRREPPPFPPPLPASCLCSSRRHTRAHCRSAVSPTPAAVRCLVPRPPLAVLRHLPVLATARRRRLASPWPARPTLGPASRLGRTPAPAASVRASLATPGAR